MKGTGISCRFFVLFLVFIVSSLSAWSHHERVGSPAHQIVSLAPNGDSVILENGSVWIIDQAGWSTVSNWNSADTLFIRPNASWFSWSKPVYRYILENRRTKERVATQCSLQPLLDSPHTLYIQKKRAYWMRLNDGSSWKVKSNDRDLLTAWDEGHIVMIGTNNKQFCWDSSSYILINMNTFDYIRVDAVDYIQ